MGDVLVGDVSQAAEAPPAPEAFAFANPAGSVQCATSQPSAESRVESA